MVVHLADGDHRRLFVQELHEVADQPCLRLSPFAQQDEVVPRQDPPLQSRKHRLLEPDDRREQRLVPGQLGQKVVAQLVLDGAVGIAGGTEVADGRGPRGVRHEPARVAGNPEKARRECAHPGETYVRKGPRYSNSSW